METPSAAASPPTRTVLGMVFLVAFLDLVGFSVIFPLFPALLEHYLTLEGPDSTIGKLASWLQEFSRSADGGSRGATIAVTTLFGGLLGSLYSLLQFLFAPIWGGLSDRFGRRKILVITLMGTVLSYVLWLFAGSFVVLIAARLLGGVMAGNLATASAVVGDVTSGKDRAKGMGILGMAIGLGFILGPALGGLTAGIDMSSGHPPAGAFALNPFSAAALVALVLSVANLLWVAWRFPETLPRDTERRRAGGRSLQPFKALAALRIPGVPRATWAYFAYLLAFSAMEFTLTFLAVERFEFTPGQIGWMFVYIGLILAIVQGGLIRRLAPRLGERRLTLFGFGATIPGLLITGACTGMGTLYLGLTFLALGSGCVMPALSALVSRYTPAQSQGLVLGGFRSAGSLSRALGPILGGLLYWKLGSAAPYWSAALFLLLPIGLAVGLPPVRAAHVVDPDEPSSPDEQQDAAD